MGKVMVESVFEPVLWKCVLNERSECRLFLVNCCRLACLYILIIWIERLLNLVEVNFSNGEDY